MKSSRQLAIAGAVLLLPASSLVASSVLGFGVPREFIHPIAVMGGLLGALVLNLLAVVRVRAERAQDGGIEAVTVRIGARAFNWALLAIDALLFAAITGYAFVENFQPR
jgi:hypothetical protein